jgi:dihydrolipoamide dehydrogenase
MYDLTIIGAGWAGLSASQEAKKSGLKVCLIEDRELGGTCLNRGCIPTKSLIHSAKIFEDFAQAQARKDKLVQQLRHGLESRINGLDFYNQSAEIPDKNTVKIKDKSIQTKFLLLATGSLPIELSSLKFDAKKIISSDEILDLKEAPKSLLIVGGGVIGCEFASLFSSLGTRVTVVELLTQLLPGEDQEVAAKLASIFKKKGIKVNTSTDAAKLDLAVYELVLVCVGRKPKLYGLDKLVLKIEGSKIFVDEFLQTSVPGVYAAGDCTGKIMLAHYAAYQARIAVHNIIHPEDPRKADNEIVPNCIFTLPEIASVGLNETKAKDKGLSVKIHKFDFLGSPMARILNDSEGFIKIVSEEKTGKILGAAIVGGRATELIGILSVAINSGLTVSRLKEVIFAHPTLSEGITSALED